MEGKKILFIYDHQFPEMWKDGLWAALELLGEKNTITKINLAKEKPILGEDKPDFILGWGAFNSPVDNFIQITDLWDNKVKKGLCLAGNTFPYNGQKYDVIFYETEWTKDWLIKTRTAPLSNLVHAFGINSKIFYEVQSPISWPIKTVRYLTVGAFADWKRQDKMLNKKGVRMALGQIQKDNLTESMGIMAKLLMDGVIVGDMVTPEKLFDFYRMAKTVYIPADVNGGGERAVLEAQAVGSEVEVEDDNPKLKELLGKAWDEVYYKDQLETGIELCLEFDNEN